ncbi:hypothetical protein SELMODRAFT_440228 [Selaginella moellendorffii]|uniref:RRM domain-containing protein n=1 Tax=Selaginella moellendorffii TaxID=88036 RepID=D8R9C1_SELML|nr:hypothetical protein SELMODRAFT_440228 [Selaginella moellendorffii]
MAGEKECVALALGNAAGLEEAPASGNDPTAAGDDEEEEVRNDGDQEGRSKGLRKCVQNLPWSMGGDAFKRLLEEQDIKFASAKKRKGKTVGFVEFDAAEHAEHAKVKLEAMTGSKGKKPKVSDALPRSWEADETGNGDAKEENAEPPKDVSEVVTPLASQSYEEQLREKRDGVATVLRKFVRHTRKCCVHGTPVPEWLTPGKEKGGMACDFEGIIASPVVEGYRNKCEFSIGSSADGESVVGFQMGMFRKGITAIGNPRNCRNVSDIAKFYAGALESFIRTSEFQVWNKENNSGFWRMLTVREGRHPRTCEEKVPTVAEVMLVVQVSPSGIANDAKMKEYERMARELSSAAFSASPPVTLTALLVQEHVGVSNAAPADAPLISLAIPGTEVSVQHIHDYIGDLQFRISPTAFFQVNSFAAEKLYALAGEWAGLGPNTLLFDICCGTGTIGLTLARKVGMVVGIEINADAVTDALTNAKLNDISNCRFVCAKAEDVVNKLLNEYEVLPEESSEDNAMDTDKKRFSNVVVIVDPPRSGLHPTVTKALRVHSRLKRLVYVSCNPDTLIANSIELCAPSSTADKQKNGRGMNIKGMSSMGYARQRMKNMPNSEPFKPVKAVAVDLFPHTHHCEMVMLLQSFDYSLNFHFTIAWV